MFDARFQLNLFFREIELHHEEVKEPSLPEDTEPLVGNVV